MKVEYWYSVLFRFWDWFIDYLSGWHLASGYGGYLCCSHLLLS